MSGSNSTKELASSLHILSIVAISSSVNFYTGKNPVTYKMKNKTTNIHYYFFFFANLFVAVHL
jgi:hypothetical protein